MDSRDLQYYMYISKFYLYRECIQLVIQHFGLSLKYGSQHIYQSLPRMLSLWLDYGVEVEEWISKPNRNESTVAGLREHMALLNQVIVFAMVH